MKKIVHFGIFSLDNAAMAARGALSMFDSFPCVCCGNRVPDESLGTVCRECFERIPFVLGPRCPGCGAENDGIFDFCGKCLKEDKRPWIGATALMRMEGAGRELIHRLKYGRNTSVARFLGDKAADAWKGTEPADVVVPTPLHWTRLVSRGFNQSELIAQAFSKNTGIPVVNLLRRRVMTRKQANLDRETRKKNLASAFSARNRQASKGLSILLLDDVLTTGATLASASETLLKAGAKEVRILVAARA